jgi:hypothetical protein
MTQLPHVILINTPSHALIILTLLVKPSLLLMQQHFVKEVAVAIVETLSTVG